MSICGSLPGTQPEHKPAYSFPASMVARESGGSTVAIIQQLAWPCHSGLTGRHAAQCHGEAGNGAATPLLPTTRGPANPVEAGTRPLPGMWAQHKPGFSLHSHHESRLPRKPRATDLGPRPLLSHLQVHKMQDRAESQEAGADPHCPEPRGHEQLQSLLQHDGTAWLSTCASVSPSRPTLPRAGSFL